MYFHGELWTTNSYLGTEIDVDGMVRVYGAPALDQYATNPDALPVTTPGPCLLYYSPTTREVMILTF